MAGHTEFQSDADLTERSEVMIGNWVSGKEFPLIFNKGSLIRPRRDDVKLGRFLIEKLKEGGAAVNETDATRNVRGKPAERVTRGQRGQTAAGEVCLSCQAKRFNTGAEI